MDILDDILTIQCDKCDANITSIKDFRNGYIFKGELQKTSLFSGSIKYKVNKEPYEFNICKKCSQKNLFQNIALTFGTGILGFAFIIQFSFDWIFYTGCGLLFIFLSILPEMAFRSKTRLDEMSVRLHKKKYPEHYEVKNTVALTRKAYSEMQPNIQLNIQESIENLKKSNKEMMMRIQQLNQKQDGAAK